jgi:polyhydroxyalkanoate synthesis regulator phasin
MKIKPYRPSSAFLCLLLAGPVFAAPGAEERSLTELRNTVVNLLQTLVEKGVITRDQATAMVKDAQNKAEAEAVAKANQDKAEAGAVRVPYVPEVVKEEIRKEVVAELGPDIKKQVVAEATSGGALREALPEWMQRFRWTGDVRVREEGDQFAKGNAANTYLDFQAINNAGGISKAGIAALLNTSEDRDRLRLRLRFGFDADLGSGFVAGMRLASGSGETFATTNQTEGTYGNKYQIAVDQGFIRWMGDWTHGRQVLTASGGRFANPYVTTDLVWYNDLTFEGVAANYRFNLSSDNTARHDLFATVGAFPLRDVTPSSQDKWLIGPQLGADIRTQGASHIRIGAAYYDFVRIAGQKNSLNSTLLDYTAPQLLQKGNTLFDIRNTNDPTQNLYALAADYKVVDLTAIADFHVLPRYSLSMTAEAVKNVGYKRADVLARTGYDVEARTKGYRADLGFGSYLLGAPYTWRAAVGYRYLERDAVVDAFNDQDFHLGGTDAKGYTLTLDFAFNPRVFARARYLASSAIDGPPLDIDVWQLDLNTQF